jgi:phosphohistidine phosphatase
MQLLIIRHAIAEELTEGSKKTDEERELTSEGRKRMRRVAKQLSRMVRIGRLGSSPLVRARETAEIVADAQGKLEIGLVEALRPGSDPQGLVAWLESMAKEEVVAIVGHEPHLSTIATWFISGRGESHIELRKGGACLIEFQDAPQSGAGMLRWLLTPKQLRQIDPKRDK